MIGQVCSGRGQCKPWSHAPLKVGREANYWEIVTPTCSNLVSLPNLQLKDPIYMYIYIYVSENVWKTPQILGFILVYHHLQPLLLYEHGQFGWICPQVDVRPAASPVQQQGLTDCNQEVSYFKSHADELRPMKYIEIPYKTYEIPYTCIWRGMKNILLSRILV